MVKNKYITEDDLNNALKEELVYLKFEDQNKLTTLMYYQDAVIDELKILMQFQNLLKQAV